MSGVLHLLLYQVEGSILLTQGSDSWGNPPHSCSLLGSGECFSIHEFTGQSHEVVKLYLNWASLKNGGPVVQSHSYCFECQDITRELCFLWWPCSIYCEGMQHPSSAWGIGICYHLLVLLQTTSQLSRLSWKATKLGNASLGWIRVWAGWERAHACIMGTGCCVGKAFNKTGLMEQPWRRPPWGPDLSWKISQRGIFDPKSQVWVLGKCSLFPARKAFVWDVSRIRLKYCQWRGIWRANFWKPITQPNAWSIWMFL